MNKMTLTLKAPLTRWRVDRSYMVQLPLDFEALSLDVLKHDLQTATNKYRPRPGRPPLGLLTFRYETDERDRVVVVHAYFTGFDNKLKRFARLRRD